MKKRNNYYDINNKEFRINQYLTLALERGEINIFIKGEKFKQCVHLAFQNPYYHPRSDGTLSIDDLEVLNNYGVIAFDIPLEETFWAHCSNLQAWVENDYDTKLLHRTIAFPLLKKLVEAGDSKAEGVFKKEIAKRFESGFLPVVKYLIEEKYLDFLSEKDLNTLLKGWKFVTLKNHNIPLLKGGLSLNKMRIESLEEIKGLREQILLKILDLGNNRLSTIPSWIEDLESLQAINLKGNRLKEIPEAIFKIKKLRTLDLAGNQINELPNFIGDLDSLEVLNLDKNHLSYLPESFVNLKSLRLLKLNHNRLKRLPEWFRFLTSLERVELKFNKLISLPSSIENLSMLKIFYIKDNPIEKSPTESVKILFELFKDKNIDLY